MSFASSKSSAGVLKLAHLVFDAVYSALKVPDQVADVVVRLPIWFALIQMPPGPTSTAPDVLMIVVTTALYSFGFCAARRERGNDDENFPHFFAPAFFAAFSLRTFALAAAALRATAVRSSGVIFSMRAAAPFLPPRAPCSRKYSNAASGSLDFVAIHMSLV